MDTLSRADKSALTAFRDWLSHPNELGRQPDGAKLIDRRVLHWPAKGKELELRLIRWWTGSPGRRSWEGNSGVGLIGSVTWCFFGRSGDWPVEDTYALHLSWELEQGKKLVIDDSMCGQIPPDSLRQRWDGLSVDRVRRVLVAKIHKTVGPPFNVEALSCRLNGQPRVLIVEDSQVSLYSPEEFFGGALIGDILEVHIGRRLLGFTLNVDRKATHPIREQIPPDVVIENWKRLETDIRSARDEARTGALRPYKNPLSGESLIVYARALKQAGQEKSILPTLDWLDACWPSSKRASGRDYLGTAAFICGYVDHAQRYLEGFREQDDAFYRMGRMHPLARLYVQSRQTQKAKDLLIACLKGSLDYTRVSSGIDRYSAEQEYQAHRELYLQLFPEDGVAELKRGQFPESSYPQ